MSEYTHDAEYLYIALTWYAWGSELLQESDVCNDFDNVEEVRTMLAAAFKSNHIAMIDWLTPRLLEFMDVLEQRDSDLSNSVTVVCSDLQRLSVSGYDEDIINSVISILACNYTKLTLDFSL